MLHQQKQLISNTNIALGIIAVIYSLCAGLGIGNLVSIISIFASIK